MIGNNETNFPHELLLTDMQVLNLHKSFANNYQLILSCPKLNCEKSGGFLSRLLGPLLKTGLPLKTLKQTFLEYRHTIQ